MQTDIKEIKTIKELENYNYLENLLHPETRRDVRVPSIVPIPSCTYKIDNQVIVNTNYRGCLLIRYNPWFLIDDMKGQYIEGKVGPTYYRMINVLSSLLYFREGSMTGETTYSPPRYEVVGRFKPCDIGQALKPGVFAKYRLVSASMEVTYVDRVQTSQGIFGGAVVYDEDRSFTGDFHASATFPAPQVETNLYDFVVYGNQYTLFDNIRHQQGYTESSCLGGLRFVYGPYDNSCEEFLPTHIEKEELIWDNNLADGLYNPHYLMPKGKANCKCFWYVYAYGFPSNSKVAIKVSSNFECLPTPEYAQYLSPIKLCYGLTDLQKKLVYDELRKHMITCLNTRYINLNS